MSEADRVFSAWDAQAGQEPSSERRRIRGTVRRRGPGAGQDRVVEVVHLRRSGREPAPEGAGPAAGRLRAESWPDGFRARPAPPAPVSDPPSAPLTAPEQPTIHARRAWTPAAPTAPPATPPARRGSRRQGSRGERGQDFADPFEVTDEGANCLRCGYRVEPAREARGLMTCRACG